MSRGHSHILLADSFETPNVGPVGPQPLQNNTTHGANPRIIVRILIFAGSLGHQNRDLTLRDRHTITRRNKYSFKGKPVENNSKQQKPPSSQLCHPAIIYDHLYTNQWCFASLEWYLEKEITRPRRALKTCELGCG